MTTYSEADLPIQAPPAVKKYVVDVVAACSGSGVVVSVIVFGSAVTGGYQPGISDVDLLLVVTDTAGDAERGRIHSIVSHLETRHAVDKRADRQHGRLAAVLRGFGDRITANQRTCFICSRADILSAEPRRVLGLSRAQALFVDRVAIPSIVASGVTVWGEDLLGSLSLPPIRRLDVAKACFGLCNQLLFAGAIFPLLPEATKYAMDALKRSIHNCYFTHYGRPAPLAVEVATFERRYGSNAAFTELLSLRQAYRPSFRFVRRCLAVVFRLHVRTAIDLSYPREVRVRGNRQMPAGDVC